MSLPPFFSSPPQPPQQMKDMNISLNGENREIPRGTTISGLLDLLGIQRDRVAVEVNVSVIKKASYGEHVLSEGDQVEVVSFVGGGTR